MKIIFGLLVVFLFLVAVISGCTQQPTSDGGDGNEQIIGGDKDEHGCLIAAGYSWCEAKQKCLRAWEEACETAVNGSNVTDDVNTEITDVDALQDDLNDSELDNLEDDLANLDW